MGKETSLNLTTLNFHRYFLVLLAILFWHSPLSAQATSEDGRFYLDFGCFIRELLLTFSLSSTTCDSAWVSRGFSVIKHV